MHSVLFLTRTTGIMFSKNEKSKGIINKCFATLKSLRTLKCSRELCAKQKQIHLRGVGILAKPRYAQMGPNHEVFISSYETE